jgi:hypothetical protein
MASSRDRAQGMPGAGRTHGPPATKKAGGSHRRFSQNIRHSPRDGFNGCSVLSLVCLENVLKILGEASEHREAAEDGAQPLGLVSLNSMSFYDTEVNLARPLRRAQTGYAKRVHTKRGCDHAKGQASFEEETHNEGHRRDGAGCGGTGSFAVRRCIGIHDARC